MKEQKEKGVSREKQKELGKYFFQIPIFKDWLFVQISTNLRI